VAEVTDTNSYAAISKEELAAKMSGKPDFVMEECYCKGVGEYCIDNALCVQLAARASLPTRYGTFTLYGFYDNREGKEHTAIVRGDVEGRERVPLRVHSECHTGDVWGSLRCDCRQQLEAATRYIAAQEAGVVRKAAASVFSTRSGRTSSRTSGWIPWKPTSTSTFPWTRGTTRWRRRSSTC